jgi:PAS domain S-box-containing protein
MALTGTPCGALSVAASGLVTDVNEVGSEWLGHPRGELVGSPLVTIFGAGSRLYYESQVRPLVHLRGSASEVFLRLRARSGEELPVICNIVGAQDHGGELREEWAFLPILRRSRYEAEIVAARRAAEEARRAESAVLGKLSAITSTVPVGIFELDASGACVFVNRRWSELTGLTPERSLGEGWHQAFHADDQGRFLAALRAAMLERREGAMEVRLALAPGPSWAACRVVAVIDANGDVTGYLGTLLETTELRLAHAQLALRARLHTVGTLAAGVAHEVNNPLAFLINDAEMLLEDLERDPVGRPRDAERQLAAIRSGADRIRRIVRDLGALARSAKDAPLPLSLETVVDKGVRMLESQLSQRAALVRHDRGAPLVDAEEDRLVEVVVQLLLNALQAVPEGRSDAHVIRVVTGTDERGGAVLTVADTGAGIPPEHIEHIFDPFFSTRSVGSGRGLGLWVTLDTVRSLGGTITVDSRPDEGTTVRVSLPRSVRLAEGATRSQP